MTEVRELNEDNRNISLSTERVHYLIIRGSSKTFASPFAKFNIRLAWNTNLLDLAKKYGQWCLYGLLGICFLTLCLAHCIQHGSINVKMDGRMSKGSFILKTKEYSVVGN